MEKITITITTTYSIVTQFTSFLNFSILIHTGTWNFSWLGRIQWAIMSFGTTAGTLAVGQRVSAAVPSRWATDLFTAGTSQWTVVTRFTSTCTCIDGFAIIHAILTFWTIFSNTFFTIRAGYTLRLHRSCVAIE